MAVGDTEKRVVQYEAPKIKKVVVHPLVLLSVVDHYSRSGKVTTGHRRVVGVLLGALRRGVLDVSNCFAAREVVVGWYHSGPKLCPNDILINELLRKFTANPVLVVVDVLRKETDGLPTEAYFSVDEVHDDGSPTTKTFDRLPSEIDAEEAEEVGIEHLLRDIKDTTLGTLTQRVGAQLEGLSGLFRDLMGIGAYLDLVAANTIPINHTIIYHLQDIFNLLPDLLRTDMIRSVHVNTNDQVLVIYVAAIARAILALHDLVSNKLANRETERLEEGTNALSITPQSPTKPTDQSADGKPDQEKKKDTKSTAGAGGESAASKDDAASAGGSSSKRAKK